MERVSSSTFTKKRNPNKEFQLPLLEGNKEKWSFSEQERLRNKNQIQKKTHPRVKNKILNTWANTFWGMNHGVFGFVGFFGFGGFFLLWVFWRIFLLWVFFFGFFQVCVIPVPGCDETFSDLG